jgi:DNA-binding XRE family transcriptional regulator
MQATIHTLFSDPYIMPNNLDAVIRDSGMNKKQVAKAAGVTAETLSRHIHGKVQMTLENAEKYAEILGVDVAKVMFQNPAAPIFCESHITKDGKIERNFLPTWTRGVQIPGFIGDDLCVAKWTADPEYHGEWYEYNNAFSFFFKQPIIEKKVHPGCIEHVSIIKLKDEIKLPGQNPQIILGGVLYPEPGRKYTCHSAKLGINLKGLEVEWATPYRSVIFRPDLAGVTVVDIESYQCC